MGNTLSFLYNKLTIMFRYNKIKPMNHYLKVKFIHPWLKPLVNGYSSLRKIKKV